MHIWKYNQKRDEALLMDLFENEGEEWADELSVEYRRALTKSLTYVAYEGDTLCGFSRSIHDSDLYIYVCDLLVHPEYRKRGIGKKLLDCLYEDYPERVVYVISDNDGYYEKLGYQQKGTLFEVNPSHKKSL